MRLASTEQQPIIVAFTNAGVPATGLTVSIAIYQVSDQSDVTPSPSTLTEIGSGLYFLPADKMPSITDDVIAFKIDGSGVLADADRYKFGALVFGGYVDGLNGFTGTGKYEINHHYDTEDALRITDENGGAVENANIYLFTLEDWNNNLRTKEYAKAWSLTDGNGRWSWNCFVDIGTYKLWIDVPGLEQKYPIEVEVTALKTIWTA